MRILFLNQYALPAGEAGITRHGEIGAELARRGHEVTVVASDFDYLSRQPTQRGGTTGKTSHNGVTFYWERTGTYVANDRRRVASIARYALAAALRAVRCRPRPDAIVGSSPQPLAPFAAWIAARLLRRPWVFEARDIWPSALVDMGAIRSGGITHRALERLERHLYTTADAVVSVPPRGLQRLAELGIDRKRTFHIPNAALPMPAANAPLPETLSALMPTDEACFTVVYTGAVGVMQDFDTVLAAIVRLKSGHPQHYGRLRMLIVGGGVAAASVQRRIDDLGLDHVRIHPPVPKASARTLLTYADACLLTLARADVFRYGVSPNKLFDYLAAGKPVLIASAYPTLVDQVEAGVRYEPGSPEALARAIIGLMDADLEELRAMGERGRETVEREYSLETVTDRYESLLSEIVASRSLLGRP